MPNTRPRKADLATAQARYQLAVVTAQRWAALSGTQAVAQQDVDIKNADMVAQRTVVAAAQQNVARYAAMVAFKRLVAPFDGIVIARNTDIGDYVNAAGGDASLRANATPLFSVADMHEMRIFVSVPQEYSTFLGPGLHATLTLPQDPDKTDSSAIPHDRERRQAGLANGRHRVDSGEPKPRLLAGYVRRRPLHVSRRSRPADRVRAGHSIPFRAYCRSPWSNRMTAFTCRTSTWDETLEPLSRFWRD